ncbi:MAG TPA: Ig-like domain-containing protein [Pseudomonas sp.]|jgi:hypothetical protein|uniref:Ig-like domain-containing protein n=1 Tax=Pseudomonas sp. TaxID=306 RepID=UPI002EDA3253
MKTANDFGSPTANDPTISGVVDSAGTSIPNPGTTQDTELTLSGTGNAAGIVSVLDNGSLIDRASVRDDGTWTTSATVALGPHSFTARATDGAESLPWVITVVNAAVKPEITSVVDSKGVSIPAGSSTSDTSVTLAGTAEPGSTVEIDDGTTSWGTAPAPGGAWTKTLAGLPLGLHSMTAITGADVSDPWAFTVIVEVQPTITSVRDSKGEVANGGTTFDTTVTLAGKAAASQQVEIFDGVTSKGTATVQASGDWTLPLTGLSLTSHSITAKGLYGSQPVSAARTFTVQQAIPPIVVDPSPVTLGGKVYIWVEGHPLPSVPPPGTYIQRTATGGKPPYTYQSSNPAIASVDGVGLVRARAQGITNISVSDTAGNSKSYQVTVTDVWRIEYIGDFTHANALKYQRPGGHLPSGAELQEIRVHYQGSWPHGERPWWSADVNGVDALAVNIPSGGAFYTLKAFPYASLSVYK